MTKNYQKESLERCLQRQNLSQKNIETILSASNLLREWTLDEPKKAQLEKIEAMVAFSFGFGPNLSGANEPYNWDNPPQYNPNIHHPGKTNEGLADSIYHFMSRRKIDIPIYAQWEIADALKKKYDIKLPEEHIAKPIEHPTKPEDKYLSTIGVISQFLKNGLDQYKTLGLIAYKLHAPRCKQKLLDQFSKQEDKKKIIIHAIPTPNAECDPDSIQPWTRDPKIYILHDIAERFSIFKFAKNQETELLKLISHILHTRKS